MSDSARVLGRITRVDSRSFFGATRVPPPDIPTFGAYCQVDAQGGQSQVIGVIFDIRIEDDEFTRQLAIVDNPPQEYLADHRFVRLVPIEVGALVIGYLRDGDYHYTLAPQPPIPLTEIRSLPPQEVVAFTERLDFVRLIAGAPGVPSEDLLASALDHAARARPQAQRRSFLLQAGREVARALGRDLPRLEGVLRRMQP